MEIQKLVNTINQIDEIEKELKPIGGTYMSDLKTISKSLNFKIWRTELKERLLQLEQKPLIIETINLLDSGFKNSMKEENDFKELKAKLIYLLPNLNDYINEQEDTTNKKLKMKKGTKIKTAFNEYTLIEQVGQGGNGKVFSAFDDDKHFVAIKFVERRISKNKLKRFKNEIHFCEHHNKHKNIVEIIDRGNVTLNETEYIFYIMPLYSETLRDKMKKKINPEDAIFIFTGILEGLKYAHKYNTIHRDIKPENIMFKKDELEPIICDFGIAHFAEEELLTFIETQKNDRLANFIYAAPEQRRKNDSYAVAQTDIYSSALILNEMFTNEIPQTSDYKTIASVAPDYKFLDDIFNQIFKHNPQDRLYPEDKILTELKIRSEQSKHEQEILKLKKVIDNITIPKSFHTSVIKKEYINGNIVFTFDNEIPSEWFNILSGEHFGGHTAIMGYEPRHLNKNGTHSIAMRLRGYESSNTIKEIVGNFMDWIQKTNVEYSNRIKRTAQLKQQEREEARKAEILKLEKEIEISKILANL